MTENMIGLAIAYLNRKLNVNLGTQYYSDIELWRYWWEGYVDNVHSYIQRGINGAPKKRKLYRMKMAKRVCEDWASLLLNEKTQIAVEHQASSEYLQGRDGTGGVLGVNNFWAEGNELLEKTFALGTGAFVVRAENVSLNAKGGIIPDTNSTVGIEYVEALNIIPLSVNKSRITECAFVSVYTQKGRDYCYIESHTKDDNGNYVIENEYFSIIGGVLKKIDNPQGIAERIETHDNIPWFAVIYPNIANNIRHNNGLGISVYADATDVLLGVDMAYNNFLRDFKLGGKKVFYNQSMLQTNEQGETITPDDVAQQLFVQLGDGVDFDAKQMYQEYNPSLRVTENKDGVQAQLDYLSFKCGMGTKRYQFEGGGVKTATEYSGEKQELVQHASRHMIPLESALKTLCRAILHIGKTICNADCDYNTQITINFEDGFIIDDETRRERDRQDVREGLLNKWEYRQKWYGETEEEAKAAIDGMATATDNPFGFMG